MTENTKASADQVAAYLRDNPDYFSTARSCWSYCACQTPKGSRLTAGTPGLHSPRP